MAIYKKDSATVLAFVHWLERTNVANVFPLDKLRKVAPYELIHVARCCEQSRAFSDYEVAQIEKDLGEAYMWKFARQAPNPHGHLFHNPAGGNAYLTHNETDKAVHRAAAVAIETWLEKETKP